MDKGQIFITMGIIIIVVLALIKTSLNLSKVLDNKRFLELGLERQEFQNLRSELTKIMQISYNQSNISENVNSFFSFAKDSFLSRATILTSVGVTASFPTVTQNQGTRLNVTFMNYLNEDISSMNLTFNNTQQNFTSIGKYSVFITNLSFTVCCNVNYSLIIRYAAGSFNSTENITIPVELAKSKLTGFFDIKISSLRLEQRDKIKETIVLNDTRRV